MLSENPCARKLWVSKASSSSSDVIISNGMRFFLVVWDQLPLLGQVRKGPLSSAPASRASVAAPTTVRIRLSFCLHGRCLLLGKQRSVGAASPPFPPARNRRPRPGRPDLGCCSPRRESAQPTPFGPACG